MNINLILEVIIFFFLFKIFQDQIIRDSQQQEYGEREKINAEYY